MNPNFTRVAILMVPLLFSLDVLGRQNITIELDTASARATLSAFGKATATDEVTRIAKLPGNQALIRQAGRFDKNATEENFVAALGQSARNASVGKPGEAGPFVPDTFRFTRLRDALAPTRNLLEQIERNPQKLTTEVINRIRLFTPEGVNMKVKVYLIAGGTSDGFAPDANNFYIALDYFEDDYEGLKLLMAHELFHNVQSLTLEGKRVVATDAPPNVRNSHNLLLNTLKEGTASVVGDPLEVAGGKKYTTWFQGKFKNNLRRIDANFALFDTLLFRLYNDPSAEPGRLYNIGFSGSFDSAMYFVGYRMAKSLEKYEGKGAIAASISDDPMKFFARYIALYQKHNDPELIKFSASTEEILKKLSAR